PMLTDTPNSEFRAPGILDGVRVVEIADELAAHAGLLLAGLGADVIKVEPPAGSGTRRIGPFAGDPSREASLFLWQHSRGKRSLVVDPADLTVLQDLLATADVVLFSGADAARFRLDVGELRERHPRLVIARMTPFGDDGPWAGFQGSDLV